MTRPFTLLSSSCSSRHARQIAAYLLEFSHAGQRRTKILNESIYNIPLAVTKGTRYKGKGPTWVLEFPIMTKRYQSDLFRRYVEGALEVDGLALADDNFPLPTKENPEIKVGVRSELKIAQAFWSWMHNGKNDTWFGNTRILRATKAWLESDDESRRRALFLTDDCLREGDALAERLVHSLGRDHEMRIHKLLRKLEWVSRTTQLNTHRKNTNFLSLEEVLYIDELIKVERPSDIRERGTVPGLKW